MRDAITLFEQYSAGGVLKRKYIEENLELIGDDFLSDFTEALIAKDSEKTLSNLDFLREKSLNVRLFLEQLLFFLRDRMKDSLKKAEFGAYAELFGVFEGIYGRLKLSPDPFLLLETGVFRCIAAHPISVIQRESPIPGQREVPASPVAIKPKERVAASPERIETISIPPASSSPKSEASTAGGPAGTFDFARFIEHIRTVPKRSFV